METVALSSPGPHELPEPTASPFAHLLGSTLGHFRLEALLGHGGMGVVFRALDTHLQRSVALKVLRPELATSEERRRLFLGEARAAATISHPNVAAVYYVGVDDGQIYIAMELAEGRTLRSRLATRFSLDEALAVATQIARGMARAHDKGVLHRDLKPENVMVGAEGEVKILDFGVARRLLAEDDAAEPYRVVGTVGYMSPEQRAGRDVDVRTDIFSFGVVLHELVTGERPFPEDAAPGDAALPPALQAIVARCVARSPAERYASMRELVAALDRLRAERARLDPGGEHAAGRAAPLPTGNVTLLVTSSADTEQLLEALGERYAAVLTRRDELLRHTLEEHRGQLVDATSDGFLFVFGEARGALRAALAARQVLAAEHWPHPAVGAVRIGVHTGELRRAGARHVGLDVHRATRIAAAAASGQLLISTATRSQLTDDDLGQLEVRDLGARRLPDLRFPERLFAIREPGAASTSEVSAVRVAHHNVPEPPTAFIGREAQIVAARALLLRAGVRVVTLTGPGGIGKTRLSIEVMRRVLDEFPAGVLQVTLAPVADPSLVMATIAQVLDAPLTAGRPALDAVKARIGDERMLLVLDNFEQVVDATPALAALLAGCPALKLLVTSRQALQLQGEHEHVVPPMHLPPGSSPADLAACESVQLFVDRVRQIHADFTLTAEHGPIIAAICARLEGLPLAIELAASRMKMLTLPALLDRLSDRLGVLKGGARDAETRHQTLRAAIDWSHNLLDDPDRRLFRRAAVFVGGFTIESAEAVCGLASDPALDVFSGLASLTEKSLLMRGEVDGEPRLGMLETLREYALDQLARTGELAPARARHAVHFLELAEAMAPDLMARAQRRAVSRVLTEADNLRAAFAWALEQPTADATVRLLRALLWLWIPQGQLTEGRDWAARAVQQARGQDAPRALAEALDVAAWLAFLSGDLAAALPPSREAVALFAALGDEAATARAKIVLAVAGFTVAPPDECERLLDEALAGCRRHGDRFGTAMALNAHGELARMRDDAPRARACYAEAIALLHACGNPFMASLISANLVIYPMRDGDWQTAAGVLDEMLAVGQEMNYPTIVYVALATMGGIAVARGAPDDGVRLIATAERLLASIGLTPEPADRAEWDRYLAAARAQLGDDGVAAAQREGATWTQSQALAAARRHGRAGSADRRQ